MRTNLKTIAAIVAVLAPAGLGLGWLVSKMPADRPAEQESVEPLPAADKPVVVDKTLPNYS